MSVFNQSRSNVIRVIFLAAFGVLILRLFFLQAFDKGYGDIATNQALIKNIVYPNRGLMLDRKGRSMVENVPAFDLFITPSQMKGMDTALFCRLLGVDTATFNKKFTEGYLKNNRNKQSPILFQALITMETHAKVEESFYRLNGVSVVQRSERSYPFNCGGNIFGYINEVDSARIAQSSGYFRMGDFAGTTGLEKFYEDVLRGERGVELFLRNSSNQVVERYKNGRYDTTPVAGRNLKTHIDVELQQLAEKLMQNKLGAAVAIEPQTGGILAMATGPGFDPNLLSGPQKRKNIGNLLTDPTGPTYNFATIGTYPPGSTFKPLGALVALDEGVMVPSSGVGCGGRYRACGGRGVGCHGGGHGGNLRNAMAASCNSYFITAFRKALDNPAYAHTRDGYQKWKEYMNAFGLGHKLGIDIPVEKGGNIPDTAKLRKEIGTANWASCNIMTMGIGQDRMLTTPLQMANAMCIIANRGYYFIPHFVDSIDGETKDDTVLNKYRKKIVTLHVPDSSYDAVFDGMEAVVTGGTARRWKIPGISMCGKTGTAENFYKGRKQEEHSWFVCFAPKENPKIAIAVLVQNAGQGAQFAAPIASLMVEKYLNDSIDKKRLQFVDHFAGKTIIPPYIKHAKFERDSVIAYRRFDETGDSAFIRPYLPPPPPPPINKDSLEKVKKEKEAKDELKKKEIKNDLLKDSKGKEAPGEKPPAKPDADKPRDRDSLKKLFARRDDD
jgi:penicillin-binding protein 2